MNKHTEGPWGLSATPASSLYDIRNITGPNCEKIATIHQRVDMTQAEALANAHLIAAAPDLLATLEALFEHCAMVHKHWGDGSNQKEADAAIKSGREAIAKAKGE